MKKTSLNMRLLQNDGDVRLPDVTLLLFRQLMSDYNSNKSLQRQLIHSKMCQYLFLYMWLTDVRTGIKDNPKQVVIHIAFERQA